MDAFTADYLTNLAAELSAPVITNVARRLRDTWQGDESSQALQRCIHAAILAMISRASLDNIESAADTEALLVDIFSEFFANSDVAVEVALQYVVDHPEPVPVDDPDPHGHLIRPVHETLDQYRERNGR